MKYRILQTSRAKADIYQLAAYIRWNLNNPKAASDFLQRYEREVELLGEFPFGFKETGIVYKGHTIESI